MIKKSIAGLSVIVVVGVVIIGYGYWSATRLPKNNPNAFLSSEPKPGKVVVCIGDSITHGRVSHNYVNELQSRHREAGFINAGINSQLAYNVLQRIDEVVKCNPDYITILIGTNDAAATLSEKNAQRYMKEQKLPRHPDRNWYEENLRAIISVLREKTTAKIALLSLPPISEDRTDKGYQRAAEYSRIVRQVATEQNLVYLPLNEKMDERLKEGADNGKTPYEPGDSGLMYRAIFCRYILGQSWDEIAENNGLLFLTDNIHLNGRGARIIAGLIDDFLAGSN